MSEPETEVYVECELCNNKYHKHIYTVEKCYNCQRLTCEECNTSDWWISCVECELKMCKAIYLKDRSNKAAKSELYSCYRINHKRQERFISPSSN